MKHYFLFLLTLVLFTSKMYSGVNSTSKAVDEVNPGVYLNFQDTPIFSKDDHPLKGLVSFNLIPPLSFQDDAINKKVLDIIQKELSLLGEVVHLKENDMRGFASGNVFLIQIANMQEWNGAKIPFSRVSLQVESSITINKTAVHTFGVLWSINSFFPGLMNSKSEEQMLRAIESLIRDFVQSYKFANQDTNKKPIFYTYY